MVVLLRYSSLELMLCSRLSFSWSSFLIFYTMSFSALLSFWRSFSFISSMPILLLLFSLSCSTVSFSWSLFSLNSASPFPVLKGTPGCGKWTLLIQVCVEGEELCMRDGEAVVSSPSQLELSLLQDLPQTVQTIL